MYNAQELVQRIKNQAKQQNILIRDMLLACDLNINAISQINDKKGMASFSLAKIADYLDCSVDYLLGRTDNPEINRWKISLSMKCISKTLLKGSPEVYRKNK